MTSSTPIAHPARLAVGVLVIVAAVAACSGAGTGTASGAPSGGLEATPPLTGESPEASMEASAEPPLGASAEPPLGASAEPSPAVSAAASGSPTTSPGAIASPGVRTVQVYALDGAFQNAPVDPAPGTVLTFRNVGKEAHEMVVVRRNDDATDKQVFTDLGKLDPAAIMTFVTVVGTLAADPGQEAAGQIVLSEPGDYAMVDLLAKGTTTAPASPDPLAVPSGVPNLATGMFATFTVVEPEAS